MVADPVGSGIVDSLARPGGNITGFMVYDYSFAGKLLDLLKEIAPHMTRVAVFRDDTNPAGIANFGVIQAMATSAGLQVTPVNVRNSDEITSAVEAFAHSPNGGAIVTGSASFTVHRDLILKLIARYKLPAIYTDRIIVANGGLIPTDRIALIFSGARPPESLGEVMRRRDFIKGIAGRIVAQTGNSLARIAKTKPATVFQSWADRWIGPRCRLSFSIIDAVKYSRRPAPGVVIVAE